MHLIDVEWYNPETERWGTAKVVSNSDVMRALSGESGIDFDYLRTVYRHKTKKENKMEFTTYIRRPFVVEAIQITEENIGEIALIIGELRTKNDVPYIALDRRLVPNVTKAHIGWWFTKLEDNYRCYAPKLFAAQFQTVGEDGRVFIFDPDEMTEEGNVPVNPGAFDVVN